MTGKMSRVVAARSTYRHGDLRRALLEAGIALAREGGPEAVVLRDNNGVEISIPADEIEDVNFTTAFDREYHVATVWRDLHTDWERGASTRGVSRCGARRSEQHRCAHRSRHLLRSDGSIRFVAPQL